MSLTKDIAEMDKLEKKLFGFLCRVIGAMKLGQDIVPLEKEYEQLRSVFYIYVIGINVLFCLFLYRQTCHQ